jgi:hypothetical protein
MIELARRLEPSRWTVHLACFAGKGASLAHAAEMAASVAASKRISLNQLARRGVLATEQPRLAAF